jgi:hypothetical protein
MKSLINVRVVAWRGTRQDQHGTILKVDGVYHCYVKWDNGDYTHYETAAIMREEFYAETDEEVGTEFPDRPEESYFRVDR